MRRFLLLSWLLWVGTPCTRCRAQQVSPPIPRFEVLGINEGLSQSTVTAIHQDRQGFIWIGTGDGLNRYDGQRIQRFWVSTEKGAPPASFVRSRIWEDSQGRIWFANDKGLHCLPPGSEKLLTVFTTSQWAGYVVMQVAGSELWAWHFQKGVLRYDLLHQTSRLYPLPDVLREAADSLYFRPLWEGPGNVFWTKRRPTGNFYFFNPQKGNWTQGPGPTPASVLCFSRGRLFFPDAAGFTEYDSSTGRKRRIAIPFGEPDPNPQRMIADRGAVYG